MIFFVIIDHSLEIYLRPAGSFWERTSIPMFLVIMGFNMGLSFQRKNIDSLKSLYSWGYFKNKLWRYIVPFLIIYAISTLIGLIIFDFSFEALLNNHFKPNWGYIKFLFIGMYPFTGPGNWFIPVIFQSILFLPLLYKFYSKSPILTLILCYVLEFCAWLFLFFTFGDITSLKEWYNVIFLQITFFFYLSAVGLGMWFSKDHNIFSKRNLFLWILFALSLTYIIAYTFFDYRIKFIRSDYNLLFYPYSAFIFLVAMKLLPKKSTNIFTDIISVIGKSTYHILLVQILYLGSLSAIFGDHYCTMISGVNRGDSLYCFLSLLNNWLICIPLGVLWWYGENKLRNLRHVRKFKRDS